MNYKSVFFLFSVMLSASAFSADDLAQRIYSFCQSSGGRVEYQPTATVDSSGRTCVTSHCQIDSRPNGSACDINIDSQSIPAGCARAVLKKCGTVVDDRGAAGAQSGSQSGAQSGAHSGSESGAQSGSQSGAQSGSQSGAQSGSQSGAQSGSGPGTQSAQSGAQSGAQAGAQSGSNGGADVIICEELEGEGRLYPGDPCYNECKPRRAVLGLFGAKKSGTERESCVRCLRNYPDRYRIRGSVGGGVAVPGVTVRTGEIRCRNSRTGEIVTVTGSGAACPSGHVVVTGSGVSSGASSGSGNGQIIVLNGGAAGSVAAGGNGGIVIGGGAGGNVNLPSICQSTRKQDIQACDQWIRNNARFQCSSGGRCIDENSVASRYDRDCPNCQAGARQQSTLSGIAEIAGAIAPPLAALGIGYFQSRAQIKSNEAWAGAAATGFEQCQLAQNNYLQYLSSNELPGLTPEQQRQMNCNGYQLSQFGGLGGGLGGLYAGGYSPGFIGGMMGPYGGYNPYGGMGGMVGGVMGGISGGMLAGGMYPAGGMMAGGYLAGGMYPAGGMYQGGMYPAGGLAGGLVNGISLAGGVASGMYQGGMLAGGMYPAGGMYQGGYLAGGMYPAGGMSGLASGGYLAGGMYPAGGMYNGGIGMAGGMYPAGGLAGGLVSGGYLAAGISGGYNPYGGMGGMYPGGWGSGVGTGMGYPGANGGYWGGAGGWGGNTGMLSAQTSNYDAMLQQRGLAYNMGQMQTGAYGGGYGTAAYSPMNLGGQLGGGLFLGGQFGGGLYGF